MKTNSREKHYFESRQIVPKKDRWQLEQLYKNITEWEKHYVQVGKKVQPLSRFKGRLQKPAVILEYFQKASAVLRQIEKLYVFAGHLSATDLANHHAQVIAQKAQDLYSKFSQATSFLGPELSRLKDDLLRQMAASKNFHEFHRELKLILARKKHILSDGEEGLLSLYSRIFSGPEDIFSSLDNVDMTFADVTDAKGKKWQLTSGNFLKFLENNDRRLREQAFGNYYRSYQSHIHTYGQTLNLCVKQHQVYAEAKKYAGCLEASLSSNMIDGKIYHSLIEHTHRALPVLHRYFALRAKKLGLKKLNMWDLRVSLAGSAPFHFTYDEAVEICLKAVAPLGAEYVKIMAGGLRGGWVDKYENKGKRNGAFSGGCYDSLPFILMNFTGTLNDVFTLVHEAGHSMHSWFARHNQPFGLSDYALFTAEIASTVNERLLTIYLLQHYSGAKRQMIIEHEIDAIRATYFRQTMFAEFELAIHREVEKGEPLTSQFFNQLYAKLNAKYHGPAVGQDQYIQFEWARIPHFYYNFYVYQYATGIAAAYYFAEQITAPNEGKKAAEMYLNFLKAGGNDFPLKQLSRAGLNFLRPDLYHAVAKNLEKCLNLLT